MVPMKQDKYTMLEAGQSGFEQHSKVSDSKVKIAV